MQDKYINSFTDRLAQVAQFQPAECKAYENNLKYYRDLKNVTDTAHGKGLEEGFEHGVALVALNMLKAGLPVGQIAQLTGLSEGQIEQLG